MNEASTELAVRTTYTTDFIVDYPNELLSLNLLETDEAKALRENFDKTLVQTIALELLSSMVKHGGVGLAANQVSCKYPIFAVNDGINKPEVFVMPKIVSTYGKTTQPEACLSCGGKTVPVERPYEIVIEYLDIHGNRKKKKRHGFSARVIAHEMDHLHGKCILDLTMAPPMV